MRTLSNHAKVSNARTDVTLFTTANSFLGLIEAGRISSGTNLDSLFWHKVDQLNEYLTCISNDDVDVTIKKPTLKENPT